MKNEVNLEMKKIYEEKKLEMILEPSALKWDAVKVYSGVVNLASKYECSNCFGFRDMAFFFVFFLQFFFSI